MYHHKSIKPIEDFDSEDVLQFFLKYNFDSNILNIIRMTIKDGRQLVQLTV